MHMPNKIVRQTIYSGEPVIIGAKKKAKEEVAKEDEEKLEEVDDSREKELEQREEQVKQMLADIEGREKSLAQKFIDLQKDEKKIKSKKQMTDAECESTRRRLSSRTRKRLFRRL